MPKASRLITSQLALVLLAEGIDEPPTEFRIFQKGVTKTSKGMFAFTDKSAAECAQRAVEYGNDFAIDYGHAMHAFYAQDPSTAGKAAGWFSPTVREGELWATKIRWTKQATQMLVDREYRYFSPVFRHSEDGEICELVSVGLTNIPATYGMDALMASRLGAGPLPPQTTLSKERTTMELAQLIALLSLNAAATESDVLAELSRRGVGLLELLTITGQKDVLGAIGAVKAWKAASDSVPALTGRITELERKENDSKLTALLTAAKAEGKVTPAMEPMLRTMPLEQLPAFLSAMPILPGLGKGKADEKPNVTDGTDSLTAAELSAAKQMKIDPKLVLEAKARIAARAKAE